MTLALLLNNATATPKLCFYVTYSGSEHKILIIPKTNKYF
ncbi:hypothetical protein DSUL_30078 [Desulfovibrionales bacterium]